MLGLAKQQTLFSLERRSYPLVVVNVQELQDLLVQQDIQSEQRSLHQLQAEAADANAALEVSNPRCTLHVLALSSPLALAFPLWPGRSIVPIP